jgi:hypothetical protein
MNVRRLIIPRTAAKLARTTGSAAHTSSSTNTTAAAGRRSIQNNLRRPSVTPNQTFDTVTVSTNNYKYDFARGCDNGYSAILKQYKILVKQSILAASISVPLSLLCFKLTGQMFNPAALSLLGAGSLCVYNRVKKIKELNLVTSVSVLSTSSPLAHSEEKEIKIRKIIAGQNPDVRLTLKGLRISGPVGDIKNHPM